MKEYLNPLKGGGYELSDTRACVNSIEVPCGGNYLYISDFGNQFTALEMGYRDATLVWQRSEPVDAEFELPSVESTLSERQGEYGEFSDVAETTQKLMSFVVGRDYSHVQLEALHMICSKLARIKHGDSKKVDTWHNIAGYATLVVNDLSK